LGQRLTGDVLHRHEGTAVVLADVVHNDDVRVPQTRDRPGLADKPLPQFRLVSTILPE
jgi:hypothetical protein